MQKLNRSGWLKDGISIDASGRVILHQPTVERIDRKRRNGGLSEASGRLEALLIKAGALKPLRD